MQKTHTVNLYPDPLPVVVGHAHMSAYICIENVTKPPVKFKQALFESALQV